MLELFSIEHIFNSRTTITDNAYNIRNARFVYEIGSRIAVV